MNMTNDQSSPEATEADLSAPRTSDDRPTLLSTAVALAIGIGASLLLELTGVWFLALGAGAVVGVLLGRGKRVFFIGGGAVVIAWSVVLAYQNADGLVAPLAAVLAAIVGLGEGLGWVFIVLTLLIGLAAGGLGALHGAFVTQLVRERG